jgi:hypothetical protein
MSIAHTSDFASSIKNDEEPLHVQIRGVDSRTLHATAFDFSVLSKFRDRLLAGRAEEPL